MNEDDETRQVRVDAILEDSLASTLDLLRDVPESPTVRGLRARVRTYRQTIQRWVSVRPSQAQRDALRDVVRELHGLALELQASETRTPVDGVPRERPPGRA